MTNLDDSIAALATRVADIKLMGGAAAVAKQHAAGKLTCRQRIDLLFDTDVDGDTTFREILLHAHHTSDSASMHGRKTPADGVVCGTGLVDRRPVAVIAYDFTVMAGTIGENTERKCARLRQFAIDRRLPLVWLLDSAGARVQEAATAMFAGSGQMFFDQVQMSGVIPQVAAMMGPCAAGTAYIPGLADFVPMTKGTSSMSLAGPPLVKAATGADVTAEELGGSKLHTRESGVGDLEVTVDQDGVEVELADKGPSAYGSKPTEHKEGKGGASITKTGASVKGELGGTGGGIAIDEIKGLTVEGKFGGVTGSANFNGDSMAYGIGVEHEFGTDDFKVEIEAELEVGLQGVTKFDRDGFVSTSHVGFYDRPPELGLKSWDKLSSEKRAEYGQQVWTETEWKAAGSLILKR